MNPLFPFLRCGVGPGTRSFGSAISTIRAAPLKIYQPNTGGQKTTREIGPLERFHGPPAAGGHPITRRFGNGAGRPHARVRSRMERQRSRQKGPPFHGRQRGMNHREIYRSGRARHTMAGTASFRFETPRHEVLNSGSHRFVLEQDLVDRPGNGHFHVIFGR